MCLDRIDEKIKKGRGYGYKCYAVRNGGLHSILRGTGRQLPEEEWIEDSWSGLIRGLYPAGFHINKFKKHARTWGGDTYRKVFYSDVVASGTAFCEPVIVARQIWITKEEI